MHYWYVVRCQTEYSQREGSHFIYRIERSPMCEYLVNFIHKLKHLPKKYMMNSVLENFTILQVFDCCLSLMPLSPFISYDCVTSQLLKLFGIFSLWLSLFA